MRNIVNAANVTSFAVHPQPHTGEKPYQCIQCERDFAPNKILNLRTHTGEKPFQCSNCDMAFSKQTNSMLHLITLTGEKPHQCS